MYLRHSKGEERGMHMTVMITDHRNRELEVKITFMELGRCLVALLAVTSSVNRK
jgi:hypothetical protein